MGFSQGCAMAVDAALTGPRRFAGVVGISGFLPTVDEFPRGFGPHAQCGREIYRDVKADDAPATIERMLKAYLANRAGAQESFADFTRRHDIDALKALFEARASE